MSKLNTETLNKDASDDDITDEVMLPEELVILQPSEMEMERPPRPRAPLPFLWQESTYDQISAAYPDETNTRNSFETIGVIRNRRSALGRRRRHHRLSLPLFAQYNNFHKPEPRKPADLNQASTSESATASALALDRMAVEGEASTFNSEPAVAQPPSDSSVDYLTASFAKRWL